MTHRSKPKRSRRTISAAGLLGATGFAGLQMVGFTDSTASAAIGNNSYEATGSAYGFDFGISNPGTIPLGLRMGMSGPVAQSTLSSLGVSGAFASFPYPGEVAQGLPAVGAGLFGFPFPDM